MMLCAQLTGSRTYRQICSQVARENNLIACFMCKPFMGVSASGCHQNISLWTGGKDEVRHRLATTQKIYRVSNTLYVSARRNNTFMPERAAVPQAGQDRAPCDRWDHRASRCVDRDRMLDRQFLSPNVGHRILGAGLSRLGVPEPHVRGLRVSAPGRFEYRAVDSMVNPYLDGSGNPEGIRRRHYSTILTRANRNSATFTRPWRTATGQETADEPGRCAGCLEEGRCHQIGPARRHASASSITTNTTNGSAFMAYLTEWDLATYLDCLP